MCKKIRICRISQSVQDLVAISSVVCIVNIYTINFLAKKVKALNMYAYKVRYFILLNSLMGCSNADRDVVNIHLQK